MTSQTFTALMRLQDEDPPPKRKVFRPKPKTDGTVELWEPLYLSNLRLWVIRNEPGIRALTGEIGLDVACELLGVWKVRNEVRGWLQSK